MTITDTQDPSTIARLNDCFRRHPGSDWMMTAGVAEKGLLFQFAATSAVRSFEAFSNSNDPHGERDFGAFEIGGQRLFWKIDYYDRNLRFGSDNPADPAVTRRVLTIMLASEY